MLGTRLTAGVCGLMQVAVGALYLGPSQLVRRPQPPDQISLVVYIEQAGPYWVFLFAVTGVFLLTAAARGKGFVVAHSVSMVAWTFYGLAIFFGAWFSEPPTPVLAATIAVFMGFIHVTLALGAAERGYR
ncbi:MULTISPECIES: hypothetical protein [unclassified Rhodococcus (in: high G+C Gram-positive bacteria)]|jgi:CHASE2 domain-containing sensor protein|uniref:hypothetical protein n=1 Tax=unclassified Rhodococcus (in: high G+C Gram-positive bacteria) TaxID=192944 RepID=UPI0006F6931A|nr:MULTISPECIES: hypothetical protein [unclassified Rhodococcus (in: high G+C Gram-positive bacteria)]KQU30352.1 hypothetical protein ASG69_04660 [Rhodococcus sp. Leaf225]KQU44743.1 hypothetical protein ASH03_12480 [Rhodococcus sp. Leaf258]